MRDVFIALLFAHGVGTREIAAAAQLSQRYVQKLVKHLQRDDDPVPDPELFDDMIIEQHRRHGEHTGRSMMEGALRDAYPGWRFPRRLIADALERLFPDEYATRLGWVQLKLRRGLRTVSGMKSSLSFDTRAAAASASSSLWAYQARCCAGPPSARLLRFSRC